MSERIWEIEAEETRKVLKIADEEIDISNMSASEVKELIKRKARELGWARVKVLVDGEEVSPEEFDEKFADAKVVEVVKADVAG
jgi:hypothetical protein